jgi:mannosyl-3-phosphoglycerate phosphatase
MSSNQSGSSIQDKRKWLVITDLDGTMLNHYDYRFDAARTALVRCSQLGIPVILNTSKTYTETLEIRKRLELDAPFIVENGSCLYFPGNAFAGRVQGRPRDGYIEVICGQPLSVIQDVLKQIGTAPASYTKLSECSVQRAVELTGLKPYEAKNAIAREFSEPLLWHGSDEQRRQFETELEQHGLSTLQGGRFLHVIGQCDKGMATRRLVQVYGDDVGTVVLGDSPNDAAMLEVADIACIVNSPSSARLAALVNADVITRNEAPGGWSEAVDQALDIINISEMSNE